MSMDPLSSSFSFSSSPSKIPLPSLEECLFGPSRRVPVIDKEDEAPPSVAVVAEEQPHAAHSSTASSGKANNHTQNENDFGDGYDSLHLGHWEEAANHHDIHMGQLRKIASQGIPDEGSYRGIVWRVLLNFLPTQGICDSWPQRVPEKRSVYQHLVDQYFETSMESGQSLRGQLRKSTRHRKQKRNKAQRNNQNNSNHSNQGKSKIDDSSNHSRSAHSTETDGEEQIEHRLPPKFREQWTRTGITLDKMTTATSGIIDLRLNCLMMPPLTDDSPQEDFQDFLEDATLLEEIRKDVARTLPHLLFFLEPNDDLGIRRYAALERILFLWAKLNKGVRYVQGMNEIAGTIYYVLANDDNIAWANHAETDSYFLFHTIMMEIRDVFVPDMDAHSTGIQGRIGNMQRLLQMHDPEVFDHLQACGIDTHFFAYRWLTTLLSREFLLPDTIRLWDSMFSSTHKENFLRYVCVTMVMHVREQLLEGDFSANLRLLQRYPPTNVDAILDSSRDLWLYERQISLACQKKGIPWQEAIQTIKPPTHVIMAYGYKKGLTPSLQERLESATGSLIGRAQRIWSGWGKDPVTEVIPATPSFEPSSAKGTGAGLWKLTLRNSEDTKERASADMMNQIQKPPLSAPGDSENGTATSNSTTPLRSRLWNRARRNTNDSEDNSELLTNNGHESHPATVGHDSATTPAPSTVTSNAPSSAARSRLWNRTRRNTNDSDDNAELMAVNEGSGSLETSKYGAVDNTAGGGAVEELKTSAATSAAAMMRAASSTTPTRSRIWSESPASQTPNENDASHQDDIDMEKTAALFPTFEDPPSKSSKDATAGVRLFPWRK